jgi:Bacillus cereus group antimicrobial protein
MFKKLAFGVLATGIALAGGIGTVSAAASDNVASPKVVSNATTDVYTTTLSNTSGIFANVWTDHSAGIKWYLKGIDYNSSTGVYTAKYEGQRI